MRVVTRSSTWRSWVTSTRPPREAGEAVLQPGDGVEVEVVGGLVEDRAGRPRPPSPTATSARARATRLAWPPDRVATSASSEAAHAEPVEHGLALPARRPTAARTVPGGQRGRLVERRRPGRPGPGGPRRPRARRVPASTPSSVDLPQPLRPTTARRSPLDTVTDRSANSGLPGRLTATPCGVDEDHGGRRYRAVGRCPTTARRPSPIGEVPAAVTPLGRLPCAATASSPVPSTSTAPDGARRPTPSVEGRPGLVVQHRATGRRGHDRRGSSTAAWPSATATPAPAGCSASTRAASASRAGRSPSCRPRPRPRRRARPPHRLGLDGGAATSGPGWPGPAASSSRASTTPSWSRRCGATTCASRAWSSSGSTAWTTWPRSSATFRPGPGRRLGVLLDHLVDGSKESRVAAAVRHPHVLVTGTPYVDVWQAVRPKAAGIDAWPVVPRGEPWKEGVLAAPRRPAPPRASSGACCSGGSRPTPTSSPPSSARSSSSSTSSRRPTAERAGRRHRVARRRHAGHRSHTSKPAAARPFVRSGHDDLDDRRGGRRHRRSTRQPCGAPSSRCCSASSRPRCSTSPPRCRSPTTWPASPGPRPTWLAATETDEPVARPRAASARLLRHRRPRPSPAPGPSGPTVRAC